MVAPDADLAIGVAVIILQVLHLALPHHTYDEIWIIQTCSSAWVDKQPYVLTTAMQCVSTSYGSGKPCRDGEAGHILALSSADYIFFTFLSRQFW